MFGIVQNGLPKFGKLLPLNGGMETFMNNETMTKRGIPGSTLKIIAITAMLIDHIGAAVFSRILINNGMNQLSMTDTEAIASFMQSNAVVYYLNLVFRLIGRLGFPIFCFLLIEGFTYTKNVWKYALRLLLFCIISEVPFDLAFNSDLLEFGYQNVFFTLFLGLCTLICIRFIEEKITINKYVKYLLMVPVVILFMFIANLLKTDYSGMGVLTIVVMYLLRKNKMLEMTGGCIILTIMSLTELPAFLTLIPLHKYNGERGLKLKYVFYAFYPVHLLILYLITYFLGIADAFKGIMYL